MGLQFKITMELLLAIYRCGDCDSLTNHDLEMITHSRKTYPMLWGWIVGLILANLLGTMMTHSREPINQLGQ